MAWYGDFSSGFGWWWIFPLVMLVLCFFMMRGRRGSLMCGFRSRGASYHISPSDSAMDVLDKRYALGEITREEYEEKRKDIARNNV